MLINGAGGGVGALTLQLAKAYGAHVTAVDSTRKLGMLRSLGADEVIDFTEEDFTQRGVRYDLIFDVPGNHPFSACRRALKPDGRYVLIGHERFGASGKRVEAGKITPVIDSTYHLSEAREAFRHMIEDEIQGKVIITATEAI